MIQTQTIQNGVADWIEYLNLKPVFENQATARPPGLYVSVSFPSFTGSFFPSSGEVNESGEQKLVDHDVKFVASLIVVGTKAGQGDLTHMEKASIIKSSIDDPAVQKLLCDARIVVYDTGPINDVTVALDTNFLPRASLDLFCYTVDEVTINTGYFAEAEVTGQTH